MASSNTSSEFTDEDISRVLSEKCDLTKSGGQNDSKSEEVTKSDSAKTDIDHETHDLLPSEVKDRHYIYFPHTYENDDEMKTNGGKWMLFADGDLDKLDYAWTVFQRLYKEGSIVGIKSSTALDTKEGVIMCYTADYEDKESVKWAADEIRKLIEYEYVMYYKTNESSAKGQYRHEGYTEICLYMHTVKCGFYEKDEYSRWTCLNINN